MAIQDHSRSSVSRLGDCGTKYFNIIISAFPLQGGSKDIVSDRHHRKSLFSTTPLALNLILFTPFLQATTANIHINLTTEETRVRLALWNGSTFIQMCLVGSVDT